MNLAGPLPHAKLHCKLQAALLIVNHPSYPNLLAFSRALTLLRSCTSMPTNFSLAVGHSQRVTHEHSGNTPTRDLLPWHI